MHYLFSIYLFYFRRWSQQYNDPTHNRFSLCMPYAPIRLFLCKSQTLRSPLCVGGGGGGGQHGGGGGGGGGYLYSA